jgi:hypothetical protein
MTNHQQSFFDQQKQYPSVNKKTETGEVCPDAFGKEALCQINRKKRTH